MWCIAMIVLLTFSLLGGADAPSDVFRPHLDGRAPAVVRELGVERRGGERPVEVRKLVFRARSIQSDGGLVHSDVYAVIARPEGATGRLPGMVIFHGGKGSAEEARAIAWARQGYVAIAPDLPGVADPALATNSAGPILTPYARDRWRATPDVTSSTIFDAVVAGLKAVDLLRSQPDVDPQRVGVSGISWGGYTTTMVAALAGDRVRAAFSTYGSGFYESCVFAKELEKMSPESRAVWLRDLDAGRRASSMTAAYFVAAPTNDSYFYPPAVRATLGEIPGDKNHLFAANNDHAAKVPGGTGVKGSPGFLAMESEFFAWHLKGEGAPLPRVTLAGGVRPGPGGARVVSVTVDGPRPVTKATGFYSAHGGTWPRRKWIEFPVEARGITGGFEGVIPASEGPVDWFVTVSDDRPVTVSSDMRTLGPAGDSPATRPASDAR